MVEANYQVLKVAGENTSWAADREVETKLAYQTLAALSEAKIAPFLFPFFKV